MWNRLNGVNLKNVAGSIRSTVSEFATEVAKQAQSLADEEEEDRISHASASGSYASETNSQTFSERSVPKSRVPPKVPQSSSGAPVSSRITALKAKLEAEKARKREAAGIPTRSQPSAEDEQIDQIPFGRQELPDEKAATRPLTAASSGDLDLTPPESLRQSPALSPELNTRSAKVTSQVNPLFADSKAPSEASPAAQSRAAPKPRKSPGADGFVDIPLNSPENVLQAVRANGKLPRSEGGGASGKQGGDESEAAQLRDQLARLKGEMLRSAAAQEEEQNRLQEEAVQKGEEIALLKTALLQEKQIAQQHLQSERAEHESRSREAKARADRDSHAAAGRGREELLAAQTKLQTLREELRVTKEEAAQSASELKDARTALQSLEIKSREQIYLHEEVKELKGQLRLTEERAAGLAASSAADNFEFGKPSEVVSQLQRLQEQLRVEGERNGALEGELAAEREAHESTLRDAEAAMLELEASKGRAAATQDVMVELQEQTSLRSAAQARAEELEASTSQALAAAAQAGALLAERDAFWTAEVRQLRERLDESQRLVHAQEAQLLHDQTEAQLLQDELRRMEGHNTSASSAFQERADGLEEEVMRLKDRLSESAAALAESASKLQNLQEENEAIKLAAAKHKTDSRANEQSLEVALKAHTAERAQREAQLLTELDSSAAVLESTRRELHEAHELLHRSETSSETQAAQLQQELERSHRDFEVVQKKLSHSQNLLDEHAAQRRLAEDDLAELQQELKRLRADFAAEHAQSAELQERLSEMAAGSGLQAEAEARHQAGLQDPEDLRRQLLSTQAACRELQAEVESLRASKGHQGSEPGEAGALKTALEQAEAERDRAKLQLSRLKQQMVTEQDEEDEKLRWRVETEVAAARAELQAAADARQQSTSGLHDQLAAAEQRVLALTEDLQAWETAVAERDAELRNLQGALGELTYESEAAERLRGQLREERRRTQDMQSELRRAQEAQEQAKAAKAAAESEVETQQRNLNSVLEREKRWAEEASMLRRALQESTKRISLLNSDSNAMVDRRIVVKLLITYFQRGQSPEILDLMGRMLGFSEDDKAAIRSKGLLGSIVKLTRTTSSSSAVPDQGGESLADSWVDFLIQQAQAADAVGETPIEARKAESATASPRSGAQMLRAAGSS